MIYSPDINGNMDGSVLRIAREIEPYTNLPIIPITRIEGFKFNPDLAGTKDYILCDYSELWWNSENTDTHVFGRNTGDFPEQFSGDEWKRFDDFVAQNPPKIYFKRELLNKDKTDWLVPIDYPCWLSELPPVQTKEDYNNRPVEVFFFWGRSHEERVKFHANCWLNSSRNGASICDNLFFFNDFLAHESNPKKWVTLNTPHYARTDISNLLAVNGMSKLSVSLFGAGRKCFRTTGESPVNSLMVMQNSEACYTYPWVHGENCLMFPNTETSAEEIDLMLRAENLYEIYVECVANCEKYKANVYFKDYVAKKIKLL